MPDLTLGLTVDLRTPGKASGLPADFQRFGIFVRLLILAVLFAAELLAISVVADGAELANRGGLLRFLAAWGPWILRCIVGFAALFMTFGYLKSKATFDRISEGLASSPVSKGFLAAHFAAIVLAGALTLALYKTSVFGLQADLIAGGWLLAGPTPPCTSHVAKP